MIITRAAGCHAQPFRFTEHELHTKGVQKITATIHETRTSNKPTDQLSQSCRWNVETKFGAIKLESWPCHNVEEIMTVGRTVLAQSTEWWVFILSPGD